MQAQCETAEVMVSCKKKADQLSLFRTLRASPFLATMISKGTGWADSLSSYFHFCGLCKWNFSA
jgi:hypothetical protein